MRPSQPPINRLTLRLAMSRSAGLPRACHRNFRDANHDGHQVPPVLKIEKALSATTRLRAQI